MANEKNITTVRDEDKSFIRVIMSLPPEKKNLIQGIIIGLDLQEKQTAMMYAIRTGSQEFKVPIDNEVVYGKIGALGHLFHVSELELPEKGA